jgi:hypothetical protein
MWSHTYNGNDLTPDRITSYAYRKYDESSSSSSSATSTSGSLEKIGFSFSDNEASSFQERHEMTLQKQGEIWVPRSVKVRRVNLAKFTSALAFTRVDTFIEPEGNWEEGTISIRRSLSTQSFSYGSDKENQLLMISSLLQSKSLALIWYGDKNTIPIGWQICDGTDNTPNLVNRVARGTNKDMAKEIGGADDIKLTVDQLPPHDHCVGDYCSVNRPQNAHGWVESYARHRTDNQREFVEMGLRWVASYSRTGDAREFEDRRRMASVGQAAKIDIRPSYTTVYYICRAS